MTIARTVIKCMCRAQNWINNTQPLERPVKMLLRMARATENRAWFACRRVATFARALETKR